MKDGKRRWSAWRFTTGSIKRIVRALLYGAEHGFLILVVGVVLFLEHRPDLEPWHTVHLDEEFTADAPVHGLDEYLALEDRLFAQLDREVYDAEPIAKDVVINRYRRGSVSDPGRWPTNWNRTFLLRAPKPRAGVLLLHGLSDSPYSMRSLAERLHESGATTLALRLPGHGTAPSGLVRVEWEDWAAAVALAAHDLHAMTGDRPLYIVGYSNGGALAVEYALAALSDPSLPPPDGLVLMSPEIGITKLAALAAWQERLGHLLGLQKMSWNSIGVEYDPFKYQSFALNAARQAYLLTNEIQGRISAAAKSGDLSRFPPLLAFQSVVDATVSAPDLVRELFQRLPPGERELVMFDIDRSSGMEPLFKHDPRAGIEDLFKDGSRAFAITLVTNEAGGSRAVVARHVGPRETTATDTALGVAWPKGLYSLSHIALPFPPDDPLYGGPDAKPSPGIQIGNAVLRGERDVLKISPADLVRIRWNPFHAYLEERAVGFVGGEGTEGQRD